MKKLLLFALLAIVAGLQSMKAQKPYAVYTENNTTLTFYYDTQRYRRTGTNYDLNQGNTLPSWFRDGIYSRVTNVVFDQSFTGARPTTTYSWFHQMTKIRTITGLEYLNTSEVTNMQGMFSACERLESINLSNFNTAKVTDMNAMFASCTALTSLDLRKFKTSNVTDMTAMFMFCSSLSVIYAGSGWNTNKVTVRDQSYAGLMFRDCTSLVGGQGTTFNPSHTDVSYAHIDGGPNNPGYLTGITSYDLWIAGIQVTPNNIDDLAELVAELDEDAMERFFEGEMEITFDDESNTLTLKNAIITPETNTYGIQSELQNLNIRLIGKNTITATNGILIQNANVPVRIYGGGSLDINASAIGLRSFADLIVDNVQIAAEGGDIGIQGRTAVNPLPKLTVQGKQTVLRAKGYDASLINFTDLILEDGLGILKPRKATYKYNSGVYVGTALVKKEWVEHQA